jgi:hypothetical protein
MRQDIFQWIENEFGEFKGVISYNENNIDKYNKKDKKIYAITEINFTVGITNASKIQLNPVTHRRWKEEIEILADLGCEGCRIRFEADASRRSGSPDIVEITQGVKPDALVMRKSFTLTVNIFKKRLTEILK